MLNRDAMEATVAALRELGRLEGVDEALVALALGLASAVDSEPGNASLWREYRAAEESLRKVGSDGDADFEALSELLRSGVRDSEDSVA